MEPPHVRGALITGPAAWTLSRVLYPDEILERLEERGYGRAWQDAALAAVKAIHAEAAAYRADVDRALAQRATEQGSDSGTSARSASEDVPPSSLVGMATVQDAAGQLGVSTRRVRALAQAGRLPGRRRGRAWELDPAGVAEYARHREAGA